jgi:hypothetical protein
MVGTIRGDKKIPVPQEYSVNVITKEEEVT